MVAHIVNHAATVGLAKVNVEVGHGHTLWIQKALKQQGVFQRIQIGNFQGIRHQRARTRTTAWAHWTAILFGPVNEVLYDEEIAWETHLNDGVQLVIQTLLILRIARRALGFVWVQNCHAIGQALVGQMPQIIVQRHAFWRWKLWQEILTQDNFHITALGNFH